MRVENTFIRRFLRVVLILVTAYASSVALSIHDMMSHYLWGPRRYYGPGGAFLAEWDKLFAFAAGGYLAWRLGWRTVSGSKPESYREPFWHWMEVAAAIILAYLILAANFNLT